jgi:cytoskeletal protein CcmA (bactofilin family)
MFNRIRQKQKKSDNKPADKQNNRTDQRNNRRAPVDYDELSMNVISQGSEIIGTLKSRRDIKVAGKIDGGVEAEGKVIVTSTGFVEGIINCEEAYIAGSVGSDIHASQKLTLASSAVVKSNLYTSNLIIEEGAVFIGFSHMEVKQPAAEEFSPEEPPTNGKKLQPEAGDGDELQTNAGIQPQEDIESDLFEEQDFEEQDKEVATEEADSELKTEN